MAYSQSSCVPPYVLTWWQSPSIAWTIDHGVRTIRYRGREIDEPKRFNGTEQRAVPRQFERIGTCCSANVEVASQNDAPTVTRVKQGDPGRQ